MARTAVFCEDCGTYNFPEDLEERNWICGGELCGAILDPPPTKAQLRFAATLGIKAPERYSQKELSEQINLAKQAEYDHRKRELELLERNHLLLDKATPEQLLTRVRELGWEFAMIIGRRGTRAKDMYLTGTSSDQQVLSYNLLLHLFHNISPSEIDKAYVSYLEQKRASSTHTDF